MTALERNIHSLINRGWYVAIGLRQGIPQAVAIREAERPVIRMGDTIGEAVSGLAGDLRCAVQAEMFREGTKG